ncbi:MAG: glycosyltransferase, partial [Myxococcota bacterium]
MRVGHLVQKFSQLSETFIYDSILSIDRLGVEQEVFALERINRDQRPFDPVHVLRKDASIGRRLPALAARAFTPRADRFSRHWIGARNHLRDALVEQRIDVVHAHFGPQGVLAMPALGPQPLIVSFYGHDISRLVQHAKWRRAYYRLWERADAIYVLSEDMARLAEAAHAPPDKIQIVHLGRRVSQLQWRPPRKRIAHLVSVGRLVEKKGHDDLIDALAESQLDLTLDIVGDGPLHDQLEEKIRLAGLGNRVRLVGALNNDKALRLLEQADAFVLASRTASDGDKEGTPTVLIEAQALGLPCVSTLHAGIPEILPKENHHLLAPERDPSSLANALRVLESSSLDELKLISKRGRSRV